MKKFNDEKLKNVVSEPTEVKSFNEFRNNFNKIQKTSTGFYFLNGVNCDYARIKGIAQTAGIKDIPTEQELQTIVK
jgi:hypothetical protein